MIIAENRHNQPCHKIAFDFEIDDLGSSQNSQPSGGPLSSGSEVCDLYEFEL